MSDSGVIAADIEIRPVRVADINVIDDDLGTAPLALSGDDADKFEIIGSRLFLKAGTVLDFQTDTAAWTSQGAWPFSSVRA